MTRSLRVLACGAAFLLSTSAQSPPNLAATTPPLENGPFTTRNFTPAPGSGRRGLPGFVPPLRTQGATIGLAERNGAFALSVSSFGKPFVADPAKLHFTVRTLDESGARPAPFEAAVGAPVLDRSFAQARPAGTLTAFHLPVTFRTRPARPGMYDVALFIDAGFTRFADGAELPVERRSELHWNVYWPDERDGDRGLRTVRAQLSGKTAWAFGGFVLSCGPASFNTYFADVAFRVRGVEREHGVVTRLWTGSTTHWGNDRAYWFFAVDPLAIRAEQPSAHAFSTGGSTQPAGNWPCPGMELADPWHAGVTLSTTPPPPLPAGYDQFKIARGMTRADVAWRTGYPQGYFTRAALDAQNVWSYYGFLDRYTVTFRAGRVVSYTVPRDLP